MKPEDRKRLKQHIEMIVEHKIPSNVVFCPNCEKETECEFTAELYECKESGEDFAKYIVARKLPDEKSKEDETFAQLKVEQYLRQQIETLQFANEGLRNELSKLKGILLKQGEFFCWASQAYAKNVNDLIYAIMAATTYDTEGEARDGKWALPKHIFDLMKRIDEDTMKFYDGAYLDTKTSTNVMEGE